MTSRLAEDPAYRSEVEAARQLGIPRRVLLGWTPRREIRHYTADGTLTGRSVEWVESPWDQLARAEVLALAQMEAERCPMCGGPAQECQSREADEAWDAKPVRCHKQTAVSEAAERMQRNPRPEALLYRIQRREDSGG